jgi:hypothetical protein
MVDYTQHYELMEALEREPRLLPAPWLYNVDDGALYAAMMDRLAQPLADGSESPFSGRNPLSGYGQLTEMEIHLLRLFGHEMNLTPDRTWLQVYRMLGIELSDAEYPVIELKFTRTQDAIDSGISARIPLGTPVGSRSYSGIVAYTTADLEITGASSEGTIPARLNQPGRLGIEVPDNEFIVLPPLLLFVGSATNSRILYQGRDRETLPEAMLRARQQLQMGQRCVTGRDYYRTALNLGAEKANVIPGIQYGDGGYYSDLVTVAVYPSTVATYIETELLSRVMMGTRLDVRGAEIIPIDGTINVRIVPSLSNQEAFDIAATAIQQNVNPPYGKWGDKQFNATVATALENQPASIYAVPKVELKHAVTGDPLEDIDIQPWNLLEVQNTIIFNWLR